MKKNTVFTTFRLVCLVFCLGFALPSVAIPIHFSAVIDGAQANAGAGTGSAGTGSATMIFDDITSMFSWDIAWSGLTGAAVAAHFHGPAAANQNAGVQVFFDHTSNPSVGSAVISANQSSDLLAGLWYINIHTAQSPAGEIRGQVLRTAVPVPATGALLLLGVAGLTLRRRLKA